MDVRGGQFLPPQTFTTTTPTLTVQIAPLVSEAEKEAFDPRAKDVLVKPCTFERLSPSEEVKTKVERRPSLETSGFSVQIRPALFRIGIVGVDIAICCGRSARLARVVDELDLINLSPSRFRMKGASTSSSSGRWRLGALDRIPGTHPTSTESESTRFHAP